MQTQLPAIIKDAFTGLGLSPENVNVILPTETYGKLIGRYDRLTLEVVRISADPEAGEVFSLTRDKKSFTKIALLKIGNALGIVWDPDRTGVIESTATKSRARATGAMRKPNGEWIPLTEEKTVDLEVIEEEQRIKFEESAEKGNPDVVTEWGTSSKTGKKYPKKFQSWTGETEKKNWIEHQVRKAVLQYRKFKDERAMTGAKERVIRALVAIRSAYTEAELARPFVFPRVTLDSSKMLEDEKTREAALQRMTGAASSIFGGTRNPAQYASDAIIDAVPHEENGEPPAGATPLPAEPLPPAQPPLSEAPVPEAEPPRRPLSEPPAQPEWPAEDSGNLFAEENEDDFEDDIPWDEESEVLKRELRKYQGNAALPKKALEMIDEILKKANPDPGEMSELQARIESYLTRKTGNKGVEK